MMLPAFKGDAADRLRFDCSREQFRVNLDGVGVVADSKGAGSKWVSGADGMLSRVVRLVVRSGEIDSVVGYGGRQVNICTPVWGESPLPAATFAGDQGRDVDFYESRLSELGGLGQERHRTAAIVDRSVAGDEMIVSILLSPFERISESELLLAEEIELAVFGTSDLSYEIISADQVVTNAKITRGTHLQNSQTALSGATLGAEYLVVTAGEFADELEPLLLWKRQMGLTTAVIDIDEILAAHDGVDDAERLREFLIESYQAGTQFVLLAGDETVLPIRYAYHANTAIVPDIALQNICDLYFADVNGNWDADGDGVYGEPAQDQPDLYGEVLVGRLPFHREQDFSAYVEKLIAYERNPGGGEYEFLNRSLFIAADQMRDYQGVGQQQLLAGAFPEYVESEVSAIVEDPTGDAVNPEYPLATEAIATMSEGWGFTTLLIHGVSDGWVLRSNQYNMWPKSFLFTGEGTDGANGFLPNLEANGKPGLVYSIGCDNGAFDMDAPPFAATNPCVAEMYLAKPDGGAVGFIGYSRWGWVATSWKLADAFIKSLYDDDALPSEALRDSKMLYPSYRDLCYGLNFFGDPAMHYWSMTPQASTLHIPSITAAGQNELLVGFRSGEDPIADARVTLTQNGEIILESQTDALGLVIIEFDFNVEDEFTVTVYRNGYVTQSKVLSPEIVLDADDETGEALPTEYKLYQNFPNPFNPTTTIAFDSPRPARAVVQIVNVLGQIVRTLTDAAVIRGRNEFVWDGRDDYGAAVSSGVYFAVARSEDFAATIKMALLK